MKRISLLILTVILLFSTANAIGLGAGGQVFLKDVLRGGFATSRLYVSNSNAYEMGVGVWITGDIADWITLSPQPEYLLQPRETLFVDVTIQPPVFVPNGVYTGEITFVTTTIGAAAGAGGGMAVAAASTIMAVVEISDNQISSFKVTSLLAERSEECRPINLKITSQNDGNINLIPTYTVSLYHNEKGFVRTQTFTQDALKPTLERQDTVSFSYTTEGLSQTWNKFLCLPAGDYYALVNAVDQTGDEYFSGKVPVYVLQKGALSVSGGLEGLQHKEVAKLGEPVKITGLFNNTGDSSELSKLKVEVYKGDRLVEIINGEETVANPGQITNVTAYFTPKELGDFKLLGSVNFGGKFTNTVESKISVEIGLTIIVIIVAIPLIVLIIAILVWLRMRRGY